MKWGRSRRRQGVHMADFMPKQHTSFMVQPPNPDKHIQRQIAETIKRQQKSQMKSQQNAHKDKQADPNVFDSYTLYGTPSYFPPGWTLEKAKKQFGTSPATGPDTGKPYTTKDYYYLTWNDELADVPSAAKQDLKPYDPSIPAKSAEDGVPHELYTPTGKPTPSDPYADYDGLDVAGALKDEEEYKKHPPKDSKTKLPGYQIPWQVSAGVGGGGALLFAVQEQLDGSVSYLGLLFMGISAYLLTAKALYAMS